jgi:hypothetical protein
MTFACQCPVSTQSRKVCVCRSCHDAPWSVHVFSSVSAFDLHRSGGRCKDPRTVVNKKTGAPLLELKTNRPYPYWGKPGRDEDAVARMRGSTQGGLPGREGTSVYPRADDGPQTPALFRQGGDGQARPP